MLQRVHRGVDGAEVGTEHEIGETYAGDDDADEPDEDLGVVIHGHCGLVECTMVWE